MVSKITTYLSNIELPLFLWSSFFRSSIINVFFSISFVYCSTCSVSILIWLSRSCIPYKIFWISHIITIRILINNLEVNPKYEIRLNEFYTYCFCGFKYNFRFFQYFKKCSLMQCFLCNAHRSFLVHKLFFSPIAMIISL